MTRKVEGDHTMPSIGDHRRNPPPTPTGTHHAVQKKHIGFPKPQAVECSGINAVKHHVADLNALGHSYGRCAECGEMGHRGLSRVIACNCRSLPR